jgi:hypothetical protein
MERAGLAGHALCDDARIFVDEDRHGISLPIRTGKLALANPFIKSKSGIKANPRERRQKAEYREYLEAEGCKQ